MCYSMRYIKSRDQAFPCGKCPKCIARRVSGWSFRLTQEEKVSSSAHFLTMTYDTKHIPITNSGLLSLNKRDLQTFFKRLRKRSTGSGPSPIKYYAVGEYGGHTQRPHYHVILFNADTDHIQPAWKQGHIHYGKVEGASIGYTLKYMSKQKRNKIGTTPNDNRLPEYAVMSKGLGISYLDDVTCEWHADDLINRMYLSLHDGRKISMPRYYKDKLYFALEKAAIAEAYALIANDKANKKLAKQTIKSIRAEREAIAAAFNRMYKSSLKTTI